MNESPIVICAPTSCPTISNSSCGSSFEGSVCHSGISSVAVPIVSGLSSSVLCPTLSITSAVSPIPPSSLSLTSLRNTVNSLNLSVPSSSHNPVILPSSASLLVQSVNSSNPVSGIHSIPTITSNSLVINDLENPNITVPMTCKNEYLSGSMTNSSFSYSSVLPVGTSTICPNLNFSAISSQTVEIIDPTQNLSSSIPTSTPATLSLQSNVLTSNQMHSENVLGFDAESGTRSVTNPTLPPCFPLNLMPISPNGDFPTTQINFPGLPPVLLQVLPLPGVKMGEHYTINVPTQLIWDGICSALASGGAVNGGPIVLSITPTSLPSHSNSPMSTVPTSYTMTNQAPTHIPLCNPSNGFINSTLPQVGVPVSTVIPYSTLSVGSLTTTVTTANVVNTKLPGVIVNSLLSNPVSAAGGAKRMRAIAPKPSNVSVVATLGIRPTSASTTLSKSGAKRHGLVTPISGVNGIMSSCTSLQSNHSSIPNIGTLTAAPTPPKLLHSTSKKVSLPLVNFSSSLVRSGRGRRRGGVGQQPVPTTFVTSAHASPICITNSVNSVMGINSDTSNVCSLQASVSLPLSSPSSLSSFYSTQSIFVPPTTNPGSLLPPGPIPPTFLFGNPLHNAPPITMPSGVAPFLFQSALPISNSCSQFSNSVFSPATCTASISPSTSCPLAVVRSLPSVSSATIFATNNAPTMASLDPTTGLVTYYPSPCIPMNSPYGPTISSSDSSSINISTICSQPNQTLGLQPSSQSGPVMYPIQTQHLLSNQIVPTIFPNMHTDITGSNAFDNTSFLQSFGPSLMDSSCISSNVQISSESAIIPSHMACQNAFLASASNFHSNGNNGTIPLFSSLPTSSIALPGLEVGTTTCETNGLTDDGGCLAKDDLISLAWHLTQMEDDFETHGKQNPDVIMNQTEDENNGMFEDFLQVYSQNTTGFNYGSDLGYQSHILDPSSVNPSSSVLDKDVILLDNEPECRTDFENPDVGTHLPCSSEESTGNADIDALLAAAAMVGAASGVGDAQSAVAVPLPSSSLASVNHQDTISSECDSSYPTNKDDVHDDIHVEFSSSRIPVHSTNCRFSPLLVPISAEDSVDGLKETKPDDLLPSDLFDDFSKTEANDQFPSETSDSVHEFDDGYEPTSLAAVLGCNAEDAADLESVLGQEAPDLSDGGGVSDSFLHSLVGPSPTVDDLNGQNNSVSIFDSDFHSPHESKQDTENEVNFHSNDFSNGISCEMVENTTNALPLSRQVRSLLRDANAISMSSHFGSPPGGSKSFNHFFEATSRRLNRSCRFTSDIDDDFIGVDFSDAVNECTTAEQFDEALMLLGPQPNSPINQSELHSENTIPVSVTDFVSHIEDKMNNENAAKDKSLLHIDCTDLKIVEVSDIQIAGSRNISPQHTVDKSVKSPISIKEFTSQNECIPSVKSPASEIKNCTIENGSKRDTTDDTMNHSVDSFCSINPANLVTVKSQHTVFDEDIIKHTDISITDDENLLSPDKKSELVDLSPSMSEELSVSGNNLTPPSQGKPNIQQPASVSSTLVACHYEVSQVTPSPNSTYSVCYNLARRPHSVSPRIPSNAKHISSSESSFYLPPRPQSLPNLTSLSQFDIVQEKENVESFISNPLSSCDITTSVACLLKSDIDFTNKELCSTFPSDHISLNTVDMISNISILGVLASSSALVEAVANLEDDSDISPIKSSIEGLASLDRMLKSCQRRSQQILNSTSHTSSGSESAIVSSSQTSSLSQSSAPKPISIHEASNNDVCNLEFSGWKNTDISSAPKHDDISTISLVNSDHSPNRSVDFEQREIKNVNTVNSKRGRRKRIGSRKPHFTYLKRNTLKTICKPNVPTLESRASQCIIEDSNEFHHFQNQSFGPPTKDVSTNDLLELVARRPHSFGLSSVEGKLSNVPNPPVSPEFESLLPPLILTTGASLFPDSRLHSDIYSLDDDSYSTIPSVHKLKVEPDEEPVTKANCERDLVSSSTPTQLRTHRRKKRKRHITDTKPRSKSQAGCHAVTESHPNPSHFDFHRNNFIGINSSDLRRFESLDEAPFERFLHDTKLQTFAALKSATIEITPKLKSNVSSWCDPNQNVLIFGRQYDNQSLSGDYDSVSAHNIESGNQFNETRSATEEVAECSSILSPRTNSNSHVFEEPVSTSSESNKSSIASHQLVFSTPVSHTFNTFPTSASFSCVSKSISPFQGHIMSLPITTTINQSNSLCDSSSSTSHSLEKVFPVVSPLPINRNLGITGSFAGAAAFRATSFSALAAKVEKKSGLSESLLNNPSETLWRNITFADLAKVASSESKSKEIPQTPNNIPSSLLCKSSWFVDKSLQIDASVLQPKPLFQSNFPIITTSSKSGDSSTMFPVNNSSPRTSPNQLNNQLPFSDMSKSSKSSLSKSHCSEGRKRSLNHMFSLPKRMNRRRRSAGRRQRRPYISTCKSTAEMIQDSPNDSNAKENNSVLNMDNISCHLVTTLDVETHDRCSDSEKLIIDYCDKPKSISSSPLFLTLENPTAPSNLNGEKYPTSPTNVMNDSSVNTFLDTIASTKAAKDNDDQTSSAPPTVQLTNVNCEQSRSVPVGTENDSCSSEVVSAVSNDGMDVHGSSVNIHPKNVASETNSFNHDVFQDKNTGSLYPDPPSNNILTESDILPSHPPIRLRLNLKLAALKSKQKKKKHKKPTLNNSTFESKWNSVVEAKDDPTKCSLSIRLVNRIPVVKEISKPNYCNSNRKREKKNKRTTTHCIGSKNFTVIVNNNLQCKNPPKSLRLDEASSPAHNIHVTQSSQAYSVPNVFPSSMLKETSMNPLSTKKIFSTARQERRSNYAQLTRPWRANLSTSPRKRSATAFRSVSSRRYVSNVTRSRSHLVNSYSGAPLADHKQLNVSCVPSIVPVNIFNKKTSNDDAEMYCDNSQSYSITNLTNIHNEFPNMERPESHPLRLVIRLGKSTNASKDELVHQSVISPLNVQVPSDMSSNSSQASSDMNRQDGSVNFTILPGQSNVGNDSSVQELSEFCIASEAETFMDPNQFQIHRILNRTLPMNSGLVGLYIPSPSGDDDEGDGCGMVERALDSEHRLRMTGQSFHFSQICHENHATPGAPHIGCTAGLSRRKETKPFKRLRHNKKNTKHARCGHGKHNNLSMDEHGLDQSSKLHAQCMKSFENHTNNDFTFLHDQPSSLSVHSTNISQPNSTNCNQIYNPDGFAHSSPEPMMNPAHFTKCKSDGNSDNTQMKFLWCNASATNKEKHHDLSALYRNEETVLSNCFSSNNVTVPSDQLSVAILKCHPKLLNDENNVYSDSAYSQQTFCNSTQTRVFEAYNNGSYTNGSSGSGFGGSCSHTGSANSIPAPSTGSPAPLSLGPAPGSQPEYSSNCTGSLNESFCGPLSPISVNRDFHCSPVSSRFDLSAPIYLENQPISHIPYSQCHENRLSGSVSSDRYVFNHFFI
ncbi:gastric mucin [Schistosoma japonicum]|nr:gastric mucin [Schistosoma japonicum]KAH8849987.1 gastric mucin [Schistosoma japonicum]